MDIEASTSICPWGGTTVFSALATPFFTGAGTGDVAFAAFGADSFVTLVFVAMMYHLRVLDRSSVALKNGGKLSQKTKELSSAV
ncbi:MAG TPA: hypothetical protein VIK21_03715 [Desulfuromonadaceae bacterium]